jgi:hypothetical protein
MAALQRTVRRSAALILVQLGVLSAQVYAVAGSGSSIATYTTLPLSVGAVAYLFGSVAYGVLSSVDAPENEQA